MSAPASGPFLRSGELTLWQAAAGYVLSIICALIPGIVMMKPGANEQAMTGQSLYALPLQMLLMFALGAVLIRLWRGRRYRRDDLGLVFPRPWGPWVLSAAGGVLFVVIGQVATAAIPALQSAGSAVSKQVGFGESLARDMVVLLSMAVFAPLGEEMLFRAVIFRGIYDFWRRKFPQSGLWPAFLGAGLLSSLAFALSHGGEGQDKQVPFLVLFGMIAAFLYWWTGSLVVAAAGHSVTNTVNAAILGYGAGGFTHPTVWIVLVASPLITIAAMWILQRSLGGRTRGEDASATAPMAQ